MGTKKEPSEGFFGVSNYNLNLMSLKKEILRSKLCLDSFVGSCVQNAYLEETM